MNEQKRQSLDFDLDDFTPRAPTPAAPDLDDFKPRAADGISAPRVDRKAISRASSFPSREAPDDDQLNIKGSKAVLDRFRALKKSERYKYSDLLEFMMDAYEEKQRASRK